MTMDWSDFNSKEDPKFTQAAAGEAAQADNTTNNNIPMVTKSGAFL
jgi:hypothetical protein